MSVIIDGMVLDICSVFVPNGRNTLTKFPIEDGALINDHVIKSNLMISVQGVVSNHPVGANADQPFLISYADDFRAALHKIRDTYKIISISDGTRRYDNLLLLAISDPADGTDSYSFTCTFERVTIKEVTTEQKETRVKLPRRKKKKKRGSVVNDKVAKGGVSLSQSQQQAAADNFALSRLSGKGSTQDGYIGTDFYTGIKKRL